MEMDSTLWMFALIAIDLFKVFKTALLRCRKKLNIVITATAISNLSTVTHQIDSTLLIIYKIILIQLRAVILVQWWVQSTSLVGCQIDAQNSSAPFQHSFELPIGL